MSTTYNGVIFEELSIDVSQPNEFAPRLVKQADAYTRGYIITLTKDGEKLTIPTANTTAWFNARNQTDPTKRASATGTINNNGTVTVIVPTTVMEVAGYIQCDVSIITASGNDTHILKSTLFYLTCEAAANPNGTSSQAEDTILAGVIAGTIAMPGLAEKANMRIIDAETSADWDGEIPTSFSGSPGDFALYDDSIWYLSEVSGSLYYWYRIADAEAVDSEIADLTAKKMAYAPLGMSSDASINALPAGQFFTTAGNNIIGLKTARAGSSGDIRIYPKSAIDAMIGDVESLLAQV